VTYSHSLVLGAVQGLTEFLPVSSSGHLILVPRLFGWPDQGLAFDAAVHLGTLGALLAYFRGELRAFATGELSRRLATLVLVATVPAAVVGLLLALGGPARDIEVGIPPGTPLEWERELFRPATTPRR